MVQVLLNLMIKIALLIALGYRVKKKGMVTPEFEKALSGLLVNVIFPISLLASSANSFSGSMLRNILIILLAAVSYYVGAILISTFLSRVIRSGQKNRNLFVSSIVFANTGYIGIPLAQVLYGTEGMFYAVMFNTMYYFFFFSYGINKLSGDTRINLKRAWNPCMKAAVLSFVLFGLQVKLPAPILSTIDSIGSMVIPVSMMIVGFGMTDIPFRDIFNSLEVYYVSFIRLLLLPSLVFLCGRLLGLSEILTMVATCMCIPPCGSFNIIVAKQYGYDAEFATKAVIQSTLLSIVSIPALLLVLKSFL